MRASLYRRGDNMDYRDYFDVTTTDIIFYDSLLKGKEKYWKEKKLTHEIVEMKPDEYIEKCTVVNGCSVDEVLSMVYKPRVEEMLKVIKVNKFPLMFIDYSSNGQEGRHRAVVAKELGLQLIPVMIIK